MGIEPTSSAWKAEVLPLNYTRIPSRREYAGYVDRQERRATGLPSATGGGDRIRTYEGMSQQIYSLPPLAAWVPLPKMSRVFSGRTAKVSTSIRSLSA